MAVTTEVDIVARSTLGSGVWCHCHSEKDKLSAVLKLPYYYTYY